MPDSLYLSLWFPSFEEPEILPRTVSVLQQFPFSAQRAGVTYVAAHGVSWNEPTVFEQRFQPGVLPEQAAGAVADFLHEDFAYAFEASWDLWAPPDRGEQWVLAPTLVRFIAQATEFEERASEATGHIQIDFGLDTSFLHDEISLTSATEQYVRNNVHKLVEFTAKVEKNADATGRLLWSESEENLAQKLIARLQKVQ